jgi:hypothetical protein
MKKTSNPIKKLHDNVMTEVQAFCLLNDVETDIGKQINKFYDSPDYKSYTGVRNDKGYANWKQSVIKRFGNHCSVCHSAEKLTAHHLNSYKYYFDLRTEINNGVCLCTTCHELFNDLYSNVNYLEQFLKFRKKFLGKSHADIRKEIKEIKAIQSVVVWRENDPPTKKIAKVKISHEKKAQSDKIVSAFEDLKQKLFSEAQALEKIHGREKGIRINFRDKETTSLSAISKLWKEITRINTLVSCNKIHDKTVMAKKFHMDHADFCKKLEDPEQYLNFTDSEITHLNKILSEDYRK